MEIDTSVGTGDDLGLTVLGLEAGLQVRHIATWDPCCVAADQAIQQVLHDVALRGFDHIPVKQDNRIRGVLVRDGETTGGWVRDHMVSLHDGMLVAAEMPLLHLIPLMEAARYYLVVQKTGITGIVTRSDMLKLPVRVCVFALITHLEMVMADRIDRLFSGEDEWRACLSQGRQDKVDEKLHKLRKDRLDSTALECTDFCDKREILATALKKLAAFTAQDAKDFTNDLKDIEALRNVLAHAGQYAEDQKHLALFVHTVEAARRWIKRLSAPKM